MSVTVVGTTKLNETRGDTFTRTLYFKDPVTDLPINITGWIIFFTLKILKTDSDTATTTIRKNISTHVDAVNGITRISLSATETNNLLGGYFYDIQYVKPDGTVKTFANDKIKFIEDITRRTTI